MVGVDYVSEKATMFSRYEKYLGYLKNNLRKNIEFFYKILTKMIAMSNE